MITPTTAISPSTSSSFATDDLFLASEEPIEVTKAIQALNALSVDDTPLPARMSASDLLEIDLFEVRAGISEYHVGSLYRSLKREGDLQSLLVLRRGGKVFLIDGRHRKDAYMQAERDDDIPVTEFLGTPQEALLEGQRLNKMHVMAMTKDERMNCAWKLVKLDASKACRFTLPQIMAVGISRGQVTTMRKVLRELEDGFDHPTWKSAMRAYNKKPDREWTEEEIEEMQIAEAEEIADRFVRVFGKRLADRPEVMGLMIERVMGRRIGPLTQFLHERNRSSYEYEDDGEGYDEDCPF